MKTRLVLTVIAMLAFAACSSGASQTPAGSPSPDTASSPAATPTPTASPTPPVVDVVVTFDGTTCAYEGPKVVPDGTVMHWTFTPTVGSALYIIPVDDGMPPDDISRGPRPLEPTSTWAYWGLDTRIYGPGTAITTAVVDRVSRQIGYLVGCGTPPETTYLFYPSVLLEVSPAA